MSKQSKANRGNLISDFLKFTIRIQDNDDLTDSDDDGDSEQKVE